MIDKISPRLSLLPAFLSPERDFPIGCLDVLKDIIKRPCTHIGSGLIEQIDEDGEYLAVKLRFVSDKLYWPGSLPLFDLYKVVTECFCEDDSHFYEVRETRVAPNDVVLDCGAAEGIFSLRVLERAKRIIAFEPLPLFIRSMEKTFAQYKSKVSILPYALSDVEGHASLSGSSLYGTVVDETKKGNIPIEITTIDKWSEDSRLKVDFIKGDLESFEYKVLCGGAETIKRDKPKIALTVYHPGNDWREMLNYCRGLVPEYAYRVKGLSYNEKYPRPVMLHLWPE
ncbi:MAG: FkbM family methyltransferase [Thermoleophilia bacterium]